MPIDEILEDPDADEDLIEPNERRPMRLLDSRIQADGELSDSDDEGEGGRRDHASKRDKDTEEESNAGTHKFGMGGGILNSGGLNTHGAGPSGHTTAVRILSATTKDSNSMDVDSPSAESNTGGSETAPAPANGKTNGSAAASGTSTPASVAMNGEAMGSPSDDKMAVDAAS